MAPVKTRKSKKSREYNLLAIAVARLRSSGQKQSEIAGQLEISQSEVSRALDHARRSEYLIPLPSLVRQNIDPDDWEEAERVYFTDQELSEKLRAWAPPNLYFEVRVLPAHDDTFCNVASVRVLELLRTASQVGLMWGRTVSKLRDGIAARQYQLDHRQYQSIKCVPLCGDPLHLMNLDFQEYSASHLAASLEKILTGQARHELPSLNGVPAYVSRRFFRKGSKERQVLEQFIQSIPGYRRIFGPPPGDGTGQRPLIEAIDALLTGAGIIGDPPHIPQERTAAFIEERLIQESLVPDRLRRLVFGDMGGLLIEREGLNPEEAVLVRELNEGWIGFTAEHLRQIALQAAPHGAPGVILLATGAAKASMIKAVIERGYVNHLLIDQSLAGALKRL